MPKSFADTLGAPKLDEALDILSKYEGELHTEVRKTLSAIRIKAQAYNGYLGETVDLTQRPDDAKALEYHFSILSALSSLAAVLDHLTPSVSFRSAQQGIAAQEIKAFLAGADKLVEAIPGSAESKYQTVCQRLEANQQFSLAHYLRSYKTDVPAHLVSIALTAHESRFSTNWATQAKTELAAILNGQSVRVEPVAEAAPAATQPNTTTQETSFCEPPVSVEDNDDVLIHPHPENVDSDFDDEDEANPLGRAILAAADQQTDSLLAEAANGWQSVEKPYNLTVEEVAVAAEPTQQDDLSPFGPTASEEEIREAQRRQLADSAMALAASNTQLSGVTSDARASLLARIHDFDLSTLKPHPKIALHKELKEHMPTLQQVKVGEKTFDKAFWMDEVAREQSEHAKFSEDVSAQKQLKKNALNELVTTANKAAHKTAIAPVLADVNARGAEARAESARSFFSDWKRKMQPSFEKIQHTANEEGSELAATQTRPKSR